MVVERGDEPGLQLRRMVERDIRETVIEEGVPEALEDAPGSFVKFRLDAPKAKAKK